MQFNLAQLMKEYTGATREYQIGEDGIDLVFVNPQARITGAVKFTRMPKSVFVSARLHTTSDVTCARCLVPVSEDLHLKIDEQYFQLTDVYTGRPVAHDEFIDADSQRIGEDHIIDLADAIRQDAQVKMAISPLCSPGCAGLCPVCGGDRNRVACSCDAALESSPFAALRALKLP